MQTCPDQGVVWRRHLHQHPEPSSEEGKTSRFGGETHAIVLHADFDFPHHTPCSGLDGTSAGIRLQPMVDVAAHGARVGHKRQRSNLAG